MHIWTMLVSNQRMYCPTTMIIIMITYGLCNTHAQSKYDASLKTATPNFFNSTETCIIHLHPGAPQNWVSHDINRYQSCT